jgi:hypothetical protein
VELAPEYPGVLCNKAEALCRIERREEALPLCDRVLELAPRVPNALLAPDRS